MDNNNHKDFFSNYLDDCRGFLKGSSFYEGSSNGFDFRDVKRDVSLFNDNLKRLNKSDFVKDKVFFDKLYNAFRFVCSNGKVDFVCFNKFSGFVYDKNSIRYYLWITLSDDGVWFNSQCFDICSNEVLSLCASYKNFDDKCSYKSDYDLNYNVGNDIFSHYVTSLVSNDYEVSNFERNCFKDVLGNFTKKEEIRRVRDCDFVIESRDCQVDSLKDYKDVDVCCYDLGNFIGKAHSNFLDSYCCYKVDDEVFEGYLNGEFSALDVYDDSKCKGRVFRLF